MTPERFTIRIPDADIADLKHRLARARLADDLPGAGWGSGVPREWLAPMLDHWAHRFDWRAHEAAMNAHAHYIVVIEGTPIHYMLVPGKGPSPRPLILTHGWPWTFWDWYAVIEPLSDPASYGGDSADAFDLIVPSLPGFGFSTPLATAGINVRAIGRIWRTLMVDVLGHDRFFAAGGDWGSMVTAELGHAYPEHLAGVHMTLPLLPAFDVRALTSDVFGEDEQWMYRRNQEVRAITKVHVMAHANAPQTLAHALSDSPAGLASWLWERRRSWTAPTSDRARDPDFLCATASLYWFTRSIGTSMRLYAEHRAAPWKPIDGREPLVAVPTGLAVAPHELILMPRALVAARTNLERWEVLPRGGHFLPVEEPEMLIDEYRAFFRPLHQTS